MLSVSSIFLYTTNNLERKICNDKKSDEMPFANFFPFLVKLIGYQIFQGLSKCIRRFKKKI